MSPRLLKAPTSIGLGATLTALLSSCASVRPPETPTDAIENEVTAFISHYARTLQGGDESAIRTLFVDDGRFAWFTDGVASYSSADDVLASLRRYKDIQFETTTSEIRVMPLTANTASASSAFRTELTIPNADDHTFGGVTTWLLERDPTSGAWRVLLGHTSTPGSPPGNDDGRER